MAVLLAVGLSARAWAEPAAAAPGRAARVIDQIESFNARLRPGDRHAKYCAMAKSPLSFYRGTNHLFWRDLAGDPRLTRFGNARTRTWIQGDAHADNIGVFDNDEGALVYDLNDFDDAVIADYQWDVWRMAVSLVLVAEEKGTLSRADIDGALDVFASAYLESMDAYRGNESERRATLTMASAYGRLVEVLQRANRANARSHMLDTWTVLVGGVRTFDRDNPDLGPVPPAVAARIQAQMAAYISRTRGRLRRIPGYFAIKDMVARHNAGMGSLGTARYYVLIEGQSRGQDDDRILDIKRQGEPAAYPYLAPAARARMDAIAANPAARSILGYRALAADADDHLGWMELADGFYSVRERSPYKKGFPLGKLDTVAEFRQVAEQWGMILASAHARADRDAGKRVIAHSVDTHIARITRGQYDRFVALVQDVAHGYARQARDDYAAFAVHVDELGLCAP